MTDPAKRRVSLVLGLPGSGVEAAAEALRRAGVAASPQPAALQPLERLAQRLASGLGISAPDPGPLAMVGRTIASSAALIDEELDASFQDRAVKLLRAAVGPGEVTLLASSTMLLLPRFWLRALAAADVGAQIVLVDRNPLALAGGEPAEVARTIRRTVFAWHYLTIRLLAEAPDAFVVAARALLEEGPIDPRLGPAAGARWSARGLAPHRRDEADLAVAPVASEQAGALALLLADWNALPSPVRHERALELAARLNEAMAVTGVARVPARRIAVTSKPRTAETASAPVTRRALGPEATAAEPAAREPAAPRRPLILHYHIFKNAGTSVDRMLKANFGAAWAEQEFDGPLRQRREEVRAFLAAHPDLDAFSSHTAMLPEPVLDDRQIVPVIFMRHPLLRLRSAYSFERTQVAETRGAVLAKSTDLRGYVEALLEDPKLRQARNFQAFRFAAGTPGTPADERARALETLERLAFVGLVEAYDASIERLGEVIRPFFPSFAPMVLHENATAKDDQPIEAKLDALQDELGPALYQRLMVENDLDLELFAWVRKRYPSAR